MEYPKHLPKKREIANTKFTIYIDKIETMIYTEFSFSENIFSKEVRYVYRPRKGAFNY